MSFSLSGTVITQSGTNTSLAGIEALAGVTRSTDDGKSFYVVSDREIRVTGTLTLDPEVESALFINENNNITFDVRGTCNFGKEIDVGALVNRFSSGTLLMFSNPNNNSYQEDESDLYISSGGTLNWYGGTVFTKRNFAIYGTLKTFSKNCEFINQHTAESQIRMRSTSSQVNGLVTRGCFLTLIANPAKWEGWVPYDCPNQALSFSNSTPDREFFIIKGFDPSGLVGQQVAFWSDVWGRLVNNALGTAVVAGANDNSGDSNTGLYEIRQEVNLEYKNLAGLDIEAEYWMTDFNNGNRVGTQINSNPSTIANRVYSGTATNGVATIASDGGVLTGTIWRDIGDGSRFANVIYDYRCQANNNNDVFTFYAIKYGYLIDQASVALKGTVPSELSRVMFLDTTIYELDKSVVDAYTTIDNAREFNDAGFAFLEDNTANYRDRIVSRAGTEIDAGSNNIIIDATASIAFSYDGSTITIKTSNFAGDLLTTGTITFANGATISGTYTDVNGTVLPPVVLSVTGLLAGSIVSIFDNETVDYENYNSLLATTVNSGTTFSYPHGGIANEVIVQVIKTGYGERTEAVILSGVNQAINIKQTIDTN